MIADLKPSNPNANLILKMSVKHIQSRRIALTIQLFNTEDRDYFINENQFSRGNPPIQTFGPSVIGCTSYLTAHTYDTPIPEEEASIAVKKLPANGYIEIKDYPFTGDCEFGRASPGTYIIKYKGGVTLFADESLTVCVGASILSGDVTFEWPHQPLW